MAQDIISCVKELTDQENSYKNMQEKYITYSKASKYQDIAIYDSFFIERDSKYFSYYSDGSKPPYCIH